MSIQKIFNKFLESQSAELQAIALRTTQEANKRIATTEEALAEKTQECLIKDSEITTLKVHLASQQTAYATSQIAAEQTMATQSKTIESLHAQVNVLTKAFNAMEKATKKILTSPKLKNPR